MFKTIPLRSRVWKVKGVSAGIFARNEVSTLPLPSVTFGPAVLKRGVALLRIYKVTVTPGSFVETLTNAREPLATTREKSVICAARVNLL